MKSQHITYDELLELASWGLFAMKFKGVQINDKRIIEYKKAPVQGAYYNGIYVGSPGMDIYMMLPFFTDKQMDEVADLVAYQFPKKPPGNHVNVGSFIRFLYGHETSSGALHSNYVSKEAGWDLSRKFVEKLFSRLEAKKNLYGMCVLSEMEAHRLGDEAALNGDPDKLVEMEKLYRKSVRLAHRCASRKQMFTPYYWAFMYFRRCGHREKSLEYCYLTIKHAYRYCPDSRPGYITKLSNCVKYIKRYKKSQWDKFCRNHQNSKNKCFKIDRVRTSRKVTVHGNRRRARLDIRGR